MKSQDVYKSQGTCNCIIDKAMITRCEARVKEDEQSTN